MNKLNQGLLSVHIAVLLFGVTALFSKLVDLNAAEITFLRTIPAMLAMALFLKYRHQPLLLKSTRDYGTVTLIGFLLAGHWVTFFHAMQVSTIATGVISLYTYPVITVFLEPLFFRQRPQFGDIISAVFVFAGVNLLVPEFSIDNAQVQGVAWGVFSAFLFSMRNIIQGRYFTRYPATLSLFYQLIIVFLVLLPFSANTLADLSNTQYLQLTVLGIFFTALPHTLYTHGLLYLKAKSVGLISCTQVVYASLFAAIVLVEIPAWSTIAGGAIVISAAAYETLHGHAKN